MNSNLRMAGSAFRQAYQWSVNTAEEERVSFAKMRGAMRRILDSNTRLLSSGYNKLVEESKSRKTHAQNRLRNILKSLTDKDTAYVLAAYNAMKERKMMMDGVGLEGQLGRKLQIRLIRKLTDKTYSQRVSAINCLKEFLVLSRDGDESRRLKYEFEMRLKDKILRRIMSSNLRMTGLAFRQSREWTFTSASTERTLANKQRGILNRMLDTNSRLLSAGYNKLLSESKSRKKVMQQKIKGLINSLSNKDMAYRRTAYNSLKQRCQMLNGQGLGAAQMKRISLIKRISNQSHNLQVMALNSLRGFLVRGREVERARGKDYERRGKDKVRVLKRIMDGNLRVMGVAFRQGRQWMVGQRGEEGIRVFKQRGVMRRILDANARLLSAGFGKLVEESRMRKNHMRFRLKALVKSLMDKDLGFKIAAYNGMKQRCRMLNGEGMGVAQMKKVSFIKRLTNQSHNFQVMAVNCLREFLNYERDHAEAKRIAHERQQREKDRILKRIMDSNLRMCGMAWRQAWQWMEDQAELERAIMAKQRGVMRRILDANTRLVSAGYNKLVEEAKSSKKALQGKLRYMLKS